MDQADQLSSLFINGIKYQDGTVVEEEGYQELQVGWEDDMYTKTAKLTNVIDVEKVSALLVGENMDEIVFP